MIDRPTSWKQRPAERAAILTQLHHLQKELPPTAGRIAAFLLAHRDDVIRMSIMEVAEQTHAAESSIVGLCRRLGMSGFQELKIVMARALVEPVRFIQEDLHEGDGFDVVADRVFAAHTSSLAQTRQLISIASLAAAVQIIRGAKRVEIYGIGSSAPIAQDLAYRLLQLGIDAKAQVDSHLQAVAAVMTNPTVAEVAVSHTGSTSETVTATKHARGAGARVIGITRLGKSPLQRYCEILLHAGPTK